MISCIVTKGICTYKARKSVNISISLHNIHLFKEYVNLAFVACCVVYLSGGIGLTTVLIPDQTGVTGTV